MLSNQSRFWAILLALFVTFLWSTSWILIKIGLKEIPALTFAGLRYLLGFFFLLPLLAWLFLGEQRSLQQMVGIVVAGAGVILVQLKVK